MFNHNFEKEIVVTGMHCMHCAKKVEDALKKIKGVKKVTVTLDGGKVKILAKTQLDDALLAATIQDLGYTVQ